MQTDKNGRIYFLCYSIYLETKEKINEYLESDEARTKRHHLFALAHHMTYDLMSGETYIKETENLLNQSQHYYFYKVFFKPGFRPMSVDELVLVKEPSRKYTSHEKKMFYDMAMSIHKYSPYLCPAKTGEKRTSDYFYSPFSN